MQTVLRITAYWVLSFFAFSILAGIFLAEGALHPRRLVLSAADQTRGREMATRTNSAFEVVQISASDGVRLQGWHLRPLQNNGNAVILLHGLSDNRAGVIGYAEMFLKHGYSVLMPDARAHGSSSGELATYGLRETNDIHRWIAWVEDKEHPHCIYGFAESMGAAGLLQSLKSETHFCAVIAESPFSNFREIAYDRVGQFFRTGPWLGRTILRPAVDAAFIYARWKYKLNFEKISPENAVASSKVPVFLIHGQIDGNIPIRHSRKIGAGNNSVILWEVPMADHCGAIGVAPEELERRAVAWFHQHSSQATEHVSATVPAVLAPPGGAQRESLAARHRSRP
jgi:dipeptidyl aminopeptidase/acylaminoacyl peptidase